MRMQWILIDVRNTRGVQQYLSDTQATYDRAFLFGVTTVPGISDDIGTEFCGFCVGFMICNFESSRYTRDIKHIEMSYQDLRPVCVPHFECFTPTPQRIACGGY